MASVVYFLIIVVVSHLSEVSSDQFEFSTSEITNIFQNLTGLPTYSCFKTECQIGNLSEFCKLNLLSDSKQLSSELNKLFNNVFNCIKSQKTCNFTLDPIEIPQTVSFKINWRFLKADISVSNVVIKGLSGLLLKDIEVSDSSSENSKVFSGGFTIPSVVYDSHYNLDGPVKFKLPGPFKNLLKDGITGTGPVSLSVSNVKADIAITITSGSGDSLYNATALQLNADVDEISPKISGLEPDFSEFLNNELLLSYWKKQKKSIQRLAEKPILNVLNSFLKIFTDDCKSTTSN